MHLKGKEAMRIARKDKEQRLLNLFDRGEATAMDELYAEYADYLTGVCYRYIGNEDDLKDVLQEAFIKIFTQIGSFQYRGSGSLKAWMTRIVINESLMFLRGKSRINNEELNDNLMQADEDPPDTGDIDATEIMKMVARLPDGYRAVFNLFAIEGMSHKEIAEQLGITPSTSASQFYKARTMLAKMIKDYRRQHGQE